MTDKDTPPSLWSPRSVDDTKKIYADWADTYDRDVTDMAYATPSRVAAALRGLKVDVTTPVLDFGCGTGLSGVALRQAGFETVDGTDISSQMLAHADVKTLPDGPVYRNTWLGDPDTIDIAKGAYDTIVATGVISLGAAPASLLATLVGLLPRGGHIAFSFNDPTLKDQSYINALDDVLHSQLADLKFREHGPHLNEKVTGSDVIVLKRK
ncbi:class I SAM-dependent DNA methyltransferase [Pseudooctadecabacter jejudonensis]|uniref:Mg-protoporphyrin IX methyl transferase n=1 Tax=Pseudooctadecabacter jejudonensis TaxID=1391910 RepID=A0A1Y5RG25_9RHOB|nr:methyltransferase [Pseudooctadecabacter jejudonensis]SLN16706.1 Mg-protoporphyrin IX methyl transferase [Pseudooctadecabacter jejudonensis]